MKTLIFIVLKVLEFAAALLGLATGIMIFYGAGALSHRIINGIWPTEESTFVICLVGFIGLLALSLLSILIFGIFIGLQKHLPRLIQHNWKLASKIESKYFKR